MLSGKPVNWQEPITQSDLKDILNSHQNRSKNKLIGKNAMTPGYGSYLFMEFCWPSAKWRNYRPRGLVKAKHTEKINGRYSWNISLEEAFEICRSSFSEEHKT